MIAFGILAAFLAVVAVLKGVSMWRRLNEPDRVTAKWLDENIRERRE